MTWLVSAKQYIPAVIGEPFGGGYFAGYISHTANGSPTHALIAAPKATGESPALQWKTTTTSTTGTSSEYDGAANTAGMVAAGISDHPAAQFCTGLTIGGFTDWYLPSRYELDIAYFNLKPSSVANLISGSPGINAFAVPRRLAAWTAAHPATTYVTNFAGGSEAFTATNYWASTEGSTTNGWRQSFGNGIANINSNKTTTHNVRAFRRIAL